MMAGLETELDPEVLDLFFVRAKERSPALAAAEFFTDPDEQVLAIVLYHQRFRKRRSRTPGEIRRIFELRRQGYSIYRIARLMDMSTSYVWKVLHGQIRKWRRIYEQEVAMRC